jgi:hypothetical protein
MPYIRSPTPAHPLQFLNSTPYPPGGGGLGLPYPSPCFTALLAPLLWSRCSLLPLLHAHHPPPSPPPPIKLPPPQGPCFVTVIVFSDHQILHAILHPKRKHRHTNSNKLA